MATVNVTNAWVLSLNSDELRLVVKALAGRLSFEELEPAADLAKAISSSRARATKTSMEQADKLLANIESDTG